jgi:hypothetical protein
MSEAIRINAPLAFQFYEIRPCIELVSHDNCDDGSVDSFTCEHEFAVARAHYSETARPHNVFWTLYGRYDHTGAGDFLAMAIGDFSTKEDAEAVRNAILAPMVRARNLIEDNEEEEADNGAVITGPERAADFLREIVENSTN